MVFHMNYFYRQLPNTGLICTMHDIWSKARVLLTYRQRLIVFAILYDESNFFEFRGKSMKKKLSILLILLATVVFWIPAEGSIPDIQSKKEKSYDKGDRGLSAIKWHGQPRRRGAGRNRDTHGYRNYGQYRRTQVGNRRYRLVRRSYLRDGNRLTRLVRVYY